MHKHKLIEIRKIIEERIGSLTEEVEIATNVKLNPLYIADRKDEFEYVLRNRVQELNLKLKESNNLRESDIIINEIDTLESILGRLADLKYGDRVRAMEIAEANQDFRRAIQLRKQINKMQDLESEISEQIQT